MLAKYINKQVTEKVIMTLFQCGFSFTGASSHHLNSYYRIAQNVGGMKLWRNHSTRAIGR